MTDNNAANTNEAQHGTRLTTLEAPQPSTSFTQLTNDNATAEAPQPSTSFTQLMNDNATAESPEPSTSFTLPTNDNATTAAAIVPQALSSSASDAQVNVASNEVSTMCSLSWMKKRHTADLQGHYLSGVIAGSATANDKGQADCTLRKRSYLSDDSDVEEIWQKPMDEVTLPIHLDPSDTELPAMPPSVEQLLKSGKSHQAWSEVSACIIT